ncbi:MAG: hypothetical protein D6758_05350 [Gammaproteobacteria bacterium]|nr:MAG: hypothetical protein D6758_05350 [Gammaproteobacteria bacterium]
MNTDRKVVYLRDVDPERALEALMRLTGLEWDSMPESLIHRENEADAAQKEQPDTANARSARPARLMDYGIKASG